MQRDSAENLYRKHLNGRWGLLRHGKEVANLYMTGRPASHIFCAAPNAGNTGEIEGSMRRTRSIRACGDFNCFKECLRACVYSTLDAMIAEGIAIAVLAKTSCGLYAGNGKFKLFVKENFPEIVQESMNEVITEGGATRGQFFKEVIIAEKSQSTSAYRKRPRHVRRYIY